MRRLAAAAATLAAVAAIWPTAALAAGEPAGVTGIALDARVELAWTPVTGATSYNVYRATTPTGITTPLATGVLTPFHTDTTAANGTSYYYVVRSVTSGVESGDSLVVQSTPKARGCASGNEIHLENCYPGDAAWKLLNQNAPSGIDGYATASSINKGESLDLKISVDSTASYRLEIFRSGYYGDVQARLFSVIRGLNGAPQPSCTTDAPTGLIDCANWTRSATITTTSSWPSGVYFARLVREDNGADNYVVFVVRDDARQSHLLYGVGFATYQAYNNFGGKSLYDFNSTGASTVAGATRAVKVSYDRPYAQARGGGHNFYFVTESAWVSWLEEQGYDIGYQSDTDMERNGARVRSHRLYTLSAHDEYYSSAMRSALEQARDAGVNLFSTGANQVYWKIRFENGAGGQDRIQVCYKSTQSGGADPSGIPTGTWRDPAGANRPENALLGVMYVGDSDSQDFPLVVKPAEATDPIYRGTSLQPPSPQPPPTTDTSIGSTIVGWEWDARVANGFEPAGVTTVASSPVSGNLIQNNGANGAPGSTTANAVKYRAPAPSNALVFAAGTNRWSHGLAGTNYAPATPDVRIQQTTLNILTDMGATPETPAAGLTIIATPAGGGGGAGDPGGGIAPTVIEKLPADGAGSVATGTTVRAIFSTDMNAATITSTSFTLAPSAGGANVAAAVAYDALSRTATLTPSAPLTLGTSYRASLDSTIQSSTNGPLAATSWTFTTASCPCKLFSPASSPVAQNNPTKDGRPGTGPFSYELGVQVKVDTPMQVNSLRFWKTAQEGGIHTGKIWSAAGAVIAQAEFALETASGWQEQPLANAVTLQPGQVYTVSVNANDFFSFTSGGLAAEVTSGPLHTVVGNNGVFAPTGGLFPAQSFNNSNYFVDLEVVIPGTAVAPSVTAVTPRSLSTTVSTGTNVTATFSTAMNAASINGTTFTVTGPGGAAVAGGVTYDGPSRTARFTPSSPLAPGTAYTATLAQSISNTGGQTLASSAVWTFTTTSSCVCSFFSPTLTPASLDNPTQDSRVGPGPWSREFGLKFTVLQATRLTAFRFYKSPAERGSHTGKLWANGALVTQAIYVTESASGWQHQALATPVDLQPGTNYTISVNANDFFAFTGAGLATQVNAGSAQTVVGENGVFSDAAGVFPAQHFNNNNYFVDLQVADTGLEAPPAPTDASPRGGERQVATTSAVRVTFSRDMDASTITSTSFTLKRPDGSAVPAVVTYHALSFTATLTPSAPLAEGTTYTATLDTTIRAAAGGPALANAIAWNFTTIDAIPPETTITSSPTNPTSSVNPSFAFTSDDATATFACQIDGAGFGGCVSPKGYTGLAEGTHTFEVRATDAQGNVDPTPASFTWAIDTTAPETSITGGPTDPSSSTTATFQFTSTEPTAATYRCSLDGAPAVLCVSGVSYSGLAEGTHTFTVASTDQAGNADTTPATHPWQINIAPPDTTITSGPLSPTTATAATFEFTSTKPAGGTFECSLDAGAPSVCTSPHTYTGPLAAGTHTFQATAIDASGRRDPTPATSSWTITAPPTVTSTVPTDAATGIATDAVVSATFSRAMDATTIGGSSFTLTPSGGSPVAASVTYNSATNVATLTPSAALATNTTYRATLTTAVKAADGVALASAVSWTFTTVNSAPTVTAKTPADTATAVAVSVAPTATFSRAMDATTITTSSFTLTPSGGSPVAATVAYNGASNTATLSPSAALANNTTYTATLTTAVKAADGVALAGSVSWTFTTINGTPTVTAKSPADATTGVATSVNPTATFSRAMDATTIGGSSFTLTPSGGSPIAASVSYDAASKVATLAPTAALANNTTYTATLTTAVKAADGVALASSISWSFTTINGAPTVTAKSPADAATGVATNVNPTATFSRAMDATTITTSSFTLTPSGGSPVAASVSYDVTSKVATLAPSAALANNTTYTATLTTAVKAADGVALASSVSWSFTTVNAAPTVTAKSPANGATGVAINVAPTATFSRAMDATTITTSSFTLTPSGGSPVAASVSYDVTSKVA
ncbi:MAG TPA: Ig-like domain-containing protein, partial [Gaiellaceae bacterium]|nr:Ig-like domain-containing protein [Gaiellaceae bacterium]